MVINYQLSRRKRRPLHADTMARLRLRVRFPTSKSKTDIPVVNRLFETRNWTPGAAEIETLHLVSHCRPRLLRAFTRDTARLRPRPWPKETLGISLTGEKKWGAYQPPVIRRMKNGEAHSLSTGLWLAWPHRVHWTDWLAAARLRCPRGYACLLELADPLRQELPSVC